MSYTPQIVSEMLDIPASTLRRYASDYADVLSDSARVGGKHRRYTDDDVRALRRIKELTRARKTPDEIRAALQVIDQPPAPSALALLPEVLQEFENLRSQLARMEIEQASTREELQDTRKRLEELEEWFRLPWYRKLRRKPPE